MKATDYIPDLYESNLEMNVTVNAYQDELETNVKPNIENEFNNGFVLIANENGIAKYEKIFNITPNPSSEDLELRRKRVLMRLISQIPFTEKFLQNQLDSIIGKDSWDYEIDYNNYTLDINVTTPGKSWLKELNDFLERIIPANILWTVHVYQCSWLSIKENFATWNDVKNYTWEEILEGSWI